MKWLTASPTPLMLCGVLYCFMAVAYWNAGQRGLSITHAAYAVANVGLILAWYEVT